MGVERDAQRLYDLIWRQFVACQMTPARISYHRLFWWMPTVLNLKPKVVPWYLMVSLKSVVKTSPMMMFIACGESR